jgi:hypothetical protein
MKPAVLVLGAALVGGAAYLLIRAEDPAPGTDPARFAPGSGPGPGDLDAGLTAGQLEAVRIALIYVSEPAKLRVLSKVLTAKGLPLAALALAKRADQIAASPSSVLDPAMSPTERSDLETVIQTETAAQCRTAAESYAARGYKGSAALLASHAAWLDTHAAEWLHDPPRT